MPLTATKLSDGEMYLQEQNPFAYNSEVEYRREIGQFNAHDDFARTHSPILALFKCTEGQRFEDGEVQKIRIPSYSGYTIKGKQMGLDVEYAYTLKSDKGGDVVKGKKEFQLTPGPWKTTLIMGVAAAVVTDNRKEHTICDCSQSIRISDKEKSANAQLIAAAPELLESLQKACNALDMEGGNDELVIECKSAINKALNPPQP